MLEHNTTYHVVDFTTNMDKIQHFLKKTLFMSIKSYICMACNNVHFFVSSYYEDRIYTVCGEVHRKIT